MSLGTFRRELKGSAFVHKGRVHGIAELAALIEEIPQYVPVPGYYLSKIRVHGRPNGTRLDVIVVFELQPPLRPRMGAGEQSPLE